MLGQGFQEYDVFCREPAMAEQDAEQVWTRTRSVLQEAVAQSGVKDIAALSLSVQGDAVIPIDQDFRPLHPAILGMDYRSQRQTTECEEKCGAFELFQRTGMRPHPMNSVTKILLLRDLAPGVFARAWKFVTYADFILGKLGAEPVIDHTMASRTMAFDLTSRRWSHEILDNLELETDRFSTPVASGTTVGTIRQDLAQELGVPTNLALVPAATTKPARPWAPAW